MGKITFAALCIIFSITSITSCDVFEYGKLGGADLTEALAPGAAAFEERMAFLSGTWYSHYAGIGRLDGYRIGKWEDFESLVVDSGKAALFPNFDPANPRTAAAGESPRPGDYFVFYDDTVYGEQDDGLGANGGWGASRSFRYMGILRGINVFNRDPDRGALIIEYLRDCAPAWDRDITEGRRFFFGIYYRVLKSDMVQMANAVDLAALYNGEKSYTEASSLEEAAALNTVENEAEFISWGVVIPQERE
jgi:hypothetical protein